MKKFKLLLILFLLPITCIIYYLTSEEHGISAYVAKQKILDKIKKKIDAIEKLHDKESLLCEEVKDLVEEAEENESDEEWEDEEEQTFEDDEDEDIDDEEEN